MMGYVVTDLLAGLGWLAQQGITIVAVLLLVLSVNDWLSGSARQRDDLSMPGEAWLAGYLRAGLGVGGSVAALGGQWPDLHQLLAWPPSDSLWRLVM